MCCYVPAINTSRVQGVLEIRSRVVILEVNFCMYGVNTVFDCFVNARTDQMKSRIQKYLEVTFCFCINKAVYDVITSHKHDTCKLNNRICSSHVGEHDQKRFVLMPY